jgi:hypothetical protein
LWIDSTIFFVAVTGIREYGNQDLSALTTVDNIVDGRWTRTISGR